MDHSTHNKIVSFIWSITDDCLRDFILPMFVLRRLGGQVEPSGEFTEYESHSKLRDSENMSLAKSKTLTATSVIHEYFICEVCPHIDETWIALDKTVISYKISFNKYFYQHKPLRSLEEVTRKSLALEAETDGRLKQLVGFVSGVK